MRCPPRGRAPPPPRAQLAGARSCDRRRRPGAGRPASASRDRGLARCAAIAGGGAMPRAREDGQRLSARGRIGDGRAGGDDGGIVARHVGDRQRDHVRRMRRGGEPAALDRARGACARSSSRRCWRRISAGAVVSACLSASVMPPAGSVSSAEPPPEIRHSTRSSAVEARRERQDARRRLPAGCVGHRMRRLDDLDRRVGTAWP